ncbi:MAG: PIG-L family deacetylase [Calditrichaeota bacterium]|nr:MAG: PIG-L family deacetylase [Calditrichota bacterium]
MKILAIGSHPDDIEYGCGGTLIRFAEQGHEVYLFVATCGNFGGSPEIRKQEQLNAAEIIGAKEVIFGDYIDTQVPMNQELIQRLENEINRIKPDLIFTHYPDDTHQDHRNLSTCAKSATRFVKDFLFFEGPTTQNFNPNIYVDVEEVITKKQALLSAHYSQVEKTNIKDVAITRFMESTASFRGIKGRVKFAEGFVAVRYFLDIPDNKPADIEVPEKFEELIAKEIKEVKKDNFTKQTKVKQKTF